MTEPLDIDSLVALLSASSAGEWTHAVDSNGYHAVTAGRSMVASIPTVLGPSYPRHDADAALIVALRNAAPRLLACYRAAVDYYAAVDAFPMRGPDEAQPTADELDAAQERINVAEDRLRAIVTGEDGDG